MTLKYIDSYVRTGTIVNSIEKNKNKTILFWSVHPSTLLIAIPWNTVPHFVTFPGSYLMTKAGSLLKLTRYIKVQIMAQISITNDNLNCQ